MLSFSLFKPSAFVVLGLFLFTSCASRKDNLKSKQAELYFGAGTQSLMDKQYTEALKNLLKANELDPDNTDVLNNLGMAYYFKGEKDLAILTLNRALHHNGKNSDALMNLASIYYKENHIDDAEKLYKKILKDLTYDKQARTYFNLGLLEFEARKNMATAEGYFKKSIKEDENFCPSHYHLGLIQYNRRRFKAALESFREATMGTCYESPAPNYYQALSLIELRRFDEARVKLDEIDTRFKKSIFAVKARSKALELNEIEKRKSSVEASRNVLESPDF